MLNLCKKKGNLARKCEYIVDSPKFLGSLKRLRKFEKLSHSTVEQSDQTIIPIICHF